MKKRKIICVILTLVFAFSLLPQLGVPVLAASSTTTIDVSDSSPTELPPGVTYSSGVYIIGVGANNTSITVVGTTSVNTINVQSSVIGLTLNLDGVSITSATASPITIFGSITPGVTLHLNDGTTSELHANGSGIAGIRFAEWLNITGTTG